MTNDVTCMRRAIELARGVDLPFGAVIVRRGTDEVLAEGVNRTDKSPTLHAEIDAINRCASMHPGIDWRELDLYATAEPCPMCQGAIEFAGIGAVHYGTSIPWLKSHGWWQIDIRGADRAAVADRRRPADRRSARSGVQRSLRSGQPATVISSGVQHETRCRYGSSR